MGWRKLRLDELQKRTTDLSGAKEIASPMNLGNCDRRKRIDHYVELESRSKMMACGY
jgi:hypothetical protein